MEIALLVMLMLMIVLIIRQTWLRLRHPPHNIMPQVEEEFEQLVLVHAIPAFSFDGSTAVIVDDRGEYEHNEANVLTLRRIHRFARNTHGEYFYLVCDGTGKPFLRHITHVNARVALGAKYLAPAVQGGEFGDF